MTNLREREDFKSTTETADILCTMVLPDCEHSRKSMFSVGPCDKCRERRKSVPEAPKSQSQSQNIRRRYSETKLVEKNDCHPHSHVHWPDEEDHALTVTIQTNSPRQSVSDHLLGHSSDSDHTSDHSADEHCEKECSKVKSILKHKQTCVVVVHTD